MFSVAGRVWKMKSVGNSGCLWYNTIRYLICLTGIFNAKNTAQGWRKSVCWAIFVMIQTVEDEKMKRNILLILLVVVLLLFCGCGKIALDKSVSPPIRNAPVPKFENGDIVKYKMLDDKIGIMMSRDHKYLQSPGAWYCVVDFYPSSAMFHLDFSQFDNYERRYVYEFELDLIRKNGEPRRISNRWNW